jgi:hypothetical protein
MRRFDVGKHFFLMHRLKVKSRNITSGLRKAKFGGYVSLEAFMHSNHAYSVGVIASLSL